MTTHDDMGRYICDLLDEADKVGPYNMCAYGYVSKRDKIFKITVELINNKPAIDEPTRKIKRKRLNWLFISLMTAGFVTVAKGIGL